MPEPSAHSGVGSRQDEGKQDQQADERDMTTSTFPIPRARTGVPGLDDILLGGLASGRVFLLEGTPGTGKTTMALSFLREGAKLGERGLYITLSETEQELRAGAESHGWQLGDDIEIFEVVPPESL